PMGQKRIMAIDPGFRTGCKTVCLDEQGALLENTTLFLHTGTGGAEQAAHTIRALIEKHQLQAIAIGNGTAGRETEAFVHKLDIPGIAVVMVNESGASIYSASETARAEFPDHDVTVRGAVPSVGDSWTRWPNWSKLIQNQSAWANISTMWTNPSYK